MHRLHKIPFITVFTALLFAMPGIPAYADDAPLSPPGKVLLAPVSIAPSGIVRNKNSVKSTIFMNGGIFYYADETVVYKVNSEPGSTHDIKKGSEIAYSFIKDDKNNRFLTKVWILKPGSIRQH